MLGTLHPHHPALLVFCAAARQCEVLSPYLTNAAFKVSSSAFLHTAPFIIICASLQQGVWACGWEELRGSNNPVPRAIPENTASNEIFALKISVQVQRWQEQTATLTRSGVAERWEVPCKAPVWETAAPCHACLRQAGGNHPRLVITDVGRIVFLLDSTGLPTSAVQPGCGKETLRGPERLNRPMAEIQRQPSSIWHGGEDCCCVAWKPKT